MKNEIPVKSLIKLSWMLAVMMSGIVCLILLHDKRTAEIILYAAMTVVTITLLGLSNIHILLRLRKRFGCNFPKLNLYRYLISYAVSAAAYIILWPLCIYFFYNGLWIYNDPVLVLTFLFGSALVNSMILVLHNSIMLQTQKIQADLELSELRIAQAEAANLLLRQQIHPHFLFNALYTLKALYKRDMNAGDTYVVHLANFLRASVSNHSSKISTVAEELAILMDYLEMQKMRFGPALDFTLSVPKERMEDFYLPSFSLQPLLENAIKHNELTERSPLNVMLSQEGDRVVMQNNLQKKSLKMDSTGHGLANLADRYRLLSGDEVIIQENEQVFSVSIKLLTNEYSDHRRRAVTGR